MYRDKLELKSKVNFHVKLSFTEKDGGKNTCAEPRYYLSLLSSLLLR
jgi:hypothetical protein